MMPAYKEYTHFTEYTSPNGRFYVTISRAPKQRKSLVKVVKRFLTAKRYAVARQRLLGLALIIIGIIGMMVFTEDAAAPCMLAFLGILRVACK